MQLLNELIKQDIMWNVDLVGGKKQLFLYIFISIFFRLIRLSWFASSMIYSIRFSVVILKLFTKQEYEIDKTLGIKGPEDVAKMDIATYNDHCRKIVMRYAQE